MQPASGRKDLLYKIPLLYELNISLLINRSRPQLAFLFSGIFHPVAHNRIKPFGSINLRVGMIKAENVCSYTKLNRKMLQEALQPILRA